MNKKKILLVDDMEWVYETAKLNLGDKYSIDYAETEKKALEMINQHRYNFVVTDYFLGNNSPRGGIKIIRAAKDKGLRVVLMSKENHRKEAKQEGAEFIFKKDLPLL